MLIFERTSAGFAMWCFVSINLNHYYLIILLKTFFTYFSAMSLHAKITFFSTSKMKNFVYKLCAFAESSILTCLLRMMELHGKNNNPRSTGFLICESEILVMKDIPPSREGIILYVIRNVSFNEKYYLNEIA